MSIPRVYIAISAITAELAETGIAKAHNNARDQYAYRSIDDVTARLAPLLAKHRLCILPRVLERSCEERSGLGGALLIRVAVRVAFDFVSGRDGSSHAIETCGEALDTGDKATSKAMTAAYKQAVLQAFCVPVSGSDDADAATHKLVGNRDQPDPDQGWDQWAFDIQDLVNVCETEEALDRVQNTYRSLLRAASSRRPDIYSAIGQVVAARREKVKITDPVEARPTGKGSSRRREYGRICDNEEIHV